MFQDATNVSRPALAPLKTFVRRHKDKSEHNVGVSSGLLMENLSPSHFSDDEPDDLATCSSSSTLAPAYCSGRRRRCSSVVMERPSLLELLPQQHRARRQHREQQACERDATYKAFMREQCAHFAEIDAEELKEEYPSPVNRKPALKYHVHRTRDGPLPTQQQPLKPRLPSQPSSQQQQQQQQCPKPALAAQVQDCQASQRPGPAGAPAFHHSPNEPLGLANQLQHLQLDGSPLVSSVCSAQAQLKHADRGAFDRSPPSGMSSMPAARSPTQPGLVVTQPEAASGSPLLQLQSSTPLAAEPCGKPMPTSLAPASAASEHEGAVLPWFPNSANTPVMAYRILAQLSSNSQREAPGTPTHQTSTMPSSEPTASHHSLLASPATATALEPSAATFSSTTPPGAVLCHEGVATTSPALAQISGPEVGTATRELDSPSSPSFTVVVATSTHQAVPATTCAPPAELMAVWVPGAAAGTQRGVSQCMSSAAAAASPVHLAGTTGGGRRVVLEEEVTMSPMQQLLQTCGQDVPACAELPSLAQFLRRHAVLSSMTKVGEGTYAEAFRYSRTVFKVIPLEGDTLYNGAPQKRAWQMEGEVYMGLQLTQLRQAVNETGVRNANITEHFVEMSGAAVCRGPYPRELVRAWRAWSKVFGSDNDPVADLPADQRYLVLLMAESGTDLEKYRIRSFSEACSMLLQTTLALAVAESALEFEHRDLHWGNVLCRPTTNQTCTFRLHGIDIEVLTHGIMTCLIDFSLSRLRGISGQLVVSDLALDPELFEGTAGDMQFDTYRHMRKLTGNVWSNSALQTNPVWVAYLAHVLVEHKGKGACFTRPQRKQLLEFRHRASNYKSCGELVTDPLFNGLWRAKAEAALAS